jgi:hypothetical protein
MAFDAARFVEAGWQRRQGTVAVPDLAGWFDKKEKPVWKIQSLEGAEIARARDAERRNKTLKSVIDGLVSENEKKKAAAIRKIVGSTDDMPDDIAYRTEILRYGSVEPAVDYPLAAMLHRSKPVVFFEITNEIIRLTGLGHEPGKAKASGKTKKSGQD